MRINNGPFPNEYTSWREQLKSIGIGLFLTIDEELYNIYLDEEDLRPLLCTYGYKGLVCNSCVASPLNEFKKKLMHLSDMSNSDSRLSNIAVLIGQLDGKNGYGKIIENDETVDKLLYLGFDSPFLHVSNWLHTGQHLDRIVDEKMFMKLDDIKQYNVGNFPGVFYTYNEEDERLYMESKKKAKK